MPATDTGPDFLPLYRQVKDLLIKRVLAGDWKPGELLPSESKLAQEYHVSQGTVRKALEEMAAEHLVVRQQGRGTFVTARGNITTPVHFFSLADANRRPVTQRTTVSMNWTIGPATARECAELGLAKGQKILRINRVRAIDGNPVLSETITIERERFPGFADILQRDPHLNTYRIMERDYGVLTVRADEFLTAVLATQREADEIGVEVGDPLLEILRISYTLDGKPADMRVIRMATGEYTYFNSVS